MSDEENKESKMLAIQVISYRLFGFNKEASVEAMKKLSEKRESGDTFNYEEYINEAISKAPKSSGADLSTFGSIVTMFNGIKP